MILIVNDGNFLLCYLRHPGLKNNNREFVVNPTFATIIFPTKIHVLDSII